MIIADIFPEDLFTAGFSTRGESVHESALTSRFRGRIYRLRQVHSREVIAIGECTPEDLSGREADGMVTNRRGALLTIWTADCVPVLLAERSGLCAAAVHAGWRGLAARIIPAAVQRMTSDFGADPRAVVAAAGPAIGPCCYEVGEEVARSLVDACGDESVAAGGEAGIRADLHRAARLQLEQSGLPPENIQVVGRCTKCDREHFYSHRGGDAVERQCGFIGLNQ